MVFETFINSCLRCVCCSLIVVISTLATQAVETLRELFGPSISVMQENDLVVRTDRHYTQGLKFTCLWREADASDSKWVSRWTDNLPDWGMRPEAARFGGNLGQNIYTPTDTAATALQVKTVRTPDFFTPDFFSKSVARRQTNMRCWITGSLISASSVPTRSARKRRTLFTRFATFRS